MFAGPAHVRGLLVGVRARDARTCGPIRARFGALIECRPTCAAM
ncbi:hypothetical protein BURMUCF1_1374 [Burkholderia multivorans ATCC BAA-247]|nr:hypothetical protein BURMUCF1_1374 [Burkholderia multivorans ATCC BAA-247]